MAVESLDQERTGRFIQSIRKELGLTQRQLAEKLMISDKTVSKWECGSGLPEISLLMPLCRELGINVNELLSGQRLTAADYQRKAEENIMYVTMAMDREAGYFKCKACGETFKPSWGAYIMGFHGITWRWLRCPKCGKFTACKHVMSREEPDEQEK